MIFKIALKNLLFVLVYLLKPINHPQNHIHLFHYYYPILSWCPQSYFLPHWSFCYHLVILLVYWNEALDVEWWWMLFRSRIHSYMCWVINFWRVVLFVMCFGSYIFFVVFLDTKTSIINFNSGDWFTLPKWL